MLNSKDLLILFKKKKINFFTGVPDSVLKNFLHVVLQREKNLDVDLAALYWHFVDVVWIVIFTVVYLFGVFEGF